MKLIKSKFACVRDNLTIRETQYRADGQEGRKLPPIIISHGFMANQQTVKGYAKQFAKWGYAAYIFDFSGGCVMGGKSDGKTTDMSVLTEKEDLKAVIEYVKGCSDVDASRLVLMGCSQGGFVSALAAAELQEQVAKLILFYPALCIPDDARQGKMMFAEFDPQHIPELIKCGPMKLGRVYPEAVIEMNPFAEISEYQGPVLIVHGTEDDIVDLSYAKTAWITYRETRKEQNLSGIPCHLCTIEGAKHGFSRESDKAAMHAVEEFMRGDIVYMEWTKEQKQQAQKDMFRKNEYELKEFVIKDGKKHPVAIICPGGGYSAVCSFVEGEPYARRLNAMGISAVVVYYRCRKKAAYPVPMDDLARAVREVFERADEWNLDMENYSVWGSSAGGHLAASFGTESMGYVKYGLPKPGALILTYPVVTMGELTHAGSRKNLLGKQPTAEMIELTSIERQVTENYPPTFVWCGDADRTVPPKNSEMLVQALEDTEVPYQFMEYPGVDHGVGLGAGLACDGWIDEAVEFWRGQQKKEE